MSFADDDLVSRLKGHSAGPDDAWVDGLTVGTIKALIARLEAAEKVCSDGHVQWCDESGKECECGYEEWRTAAGK